MINVPVNEQISINRYQSALERPNRAYHGFMMVKRGLSPIPRPEPCVVLTRNEPWLTEGIVRIKCTPLHIKDIRVLDPATCEFTRGAYMGPEG